MPPTIPEKDEISEEEKDPLPPPVKPNPLANFSEIELKLMETPFETALDNSLVMLLFSDPDEWFYYNQMKQDREYPNAVKIYEGIIKMICAGSYVKGENYPRKYAFDSYPEFTHDYDNAIRAVEYDHPEFFYLQLCHTYYSWNGDKVIFHIEGLYDSLEELRADEMRAYEGSFDRIEEFKERMIQYKNRPYPTESETLKGSALVDEQIRWLHDAYAYAWYYHSTNFDYRIGQSAYGMLTQRRGVCEGMSLSLLYFAKILNIDATIVVVTGDIPNGYHAWNAYVNGKGEWKEFDATHRISTNKTGQFIQYNALTRFYMDLSPHCRVKSSSQN